jgi:hypothetical protein
VPSERRFSCTISSVTVTAFERPLPIGKLTPPPSPRPAKPPPAETTTADADRDR